MKLKDILTAEMYDRYGDMDVYSDCIDDIAPCWCGTLLTEYGKEYYAEALEVEADIDEESNFIGWCILTYTDCEEDCEKKWYKVTELFNDMAGCCSEEHYDKCFINE